jgi:hypothetical protein
MQASVSSRHWQSTWGTGGRMPPCAMHKSSAFNHVDVAAEVLTFDTALLLQCDHAANHI